MSFRVHLARTKERVKRRLGVNSGILDSSSSPNPSQRSPKPAFQILQHATKPTPSTTNSASFPNATFPANVPPSSPVDPVPPRAAPTTILSSHAPPDSNPSIAATTMNAPRNLGRVKSVAWTGLRTLLKVVQSSPDTFPPLKAVVGGLNQYLDIFESASKGRKDYEELQVKLDALLGDLAKFLDSANSPNMTRSIDNLSIAIGQELTLIEERSQRSAGRKYAEALEEADNIMECYRRIEGHLQRLSLNANLSAWGTIDNIEIGLRDTRLRQLLPTMSAVFNSAGSGDVQRRECTPGTRSLEIAKLLEWARSWETEGVYWLNGMAGTGKTTIAYSLCLKLEKSAMLGASFFCSRSIPECRNVNLILPAIAYQLARFSEPFQHALTKVLKADPDVHSRVLDVQFSRLLIDPLLEVKDALPADLVVVIDALDECEHEDSVGQILDLLLSSTATTNLPVRFLISSRPEPEIYRRMMNRLGHSLETRLVLHDLDKEEVQRDIEKYLEAELKDFDITTSQRSALVDMSGVLFIYASTVVRYIKDGVYFADLEERLDALLDSPGRSSTGDKYQQIDALYTTILEVAFRNKRLGDLGRTRMKTILDTVICAQEPMTTKGLAGLLGIKSAEHVDALLRPLCSVLNISETNNIVTTLHASFPDYMLHQGRSSHFYCAPNVNHVRLAHACLNVIKSNSPQFNICALESSYAFDEDLVGLDELVDRAVSSELFYACQYWVLHVIFGNTKDLDGPLLEFLSEHILLWMEVLNLKKSMKLGPEIIRRAESWSRDNGLSIETVDLVHDAWRFVTTFAGHAISQSTPHIYVSMLPFWPESAPISTHYGQRIHRAIKPRGTAMTRRNHALLATWTFQEPTRSACFSPDATLVAFGAKSSVYIIDGATGSTVIGPLEHYGEVLSVAFSPDGKLVASGLVDGTIRIWSTQSGQAVGAPFTGHIDRVNSVCFTPDGSTIVSGSSDETIRLWDAITGRTVRNPLRGHRGSVYSVCVSPDGTRVASGSFDDTIRLWNIESGQMILQPLEGHTDSVMSVCFSPDGTRIVSGSDDRTIRIWSTENGQTIGDPLQGHADAVWSIAFSHDGKHIVSGSDDNTVRLWNTDGTSGSVQPLEGHTSFVSSVAFSPDSTRIVSSSDDKTIRVWDARSNGPIDSFLEGHEDVIESVAFSHGGTHIVSSSNDQTIRIWDALSGRMAVGPLRGHTEWIRSACFSPDDTLVASCSDDYTIRLWDAKYGYPVGKPLTGHSSRIFSICFSPDGALVASSSDNSTIEIRATQSGNLVTSPFEGHTLYVWSVDFSPDGTRIASGSWDRTIRVWEIQSGRTVVGPIKGHGDYVHCVRFSPDGTRIASASKDKTLRLWDASSGDMVGSPLEGHRDDVRSVCFSSDGQLIVSGSDDKTIRLWSAQSGRAVSSILVGHVQPVYSVAFSPDRKHVVSGSGDQTIRIWEVGDLLDPPVLEDPALSPDGDHSISVHPHDSWVLQEDGWVVGPRSQLLAWVPPDLHLPLLRPRNTVLMSTIGYWRLGFEPAQLGEAWVGCYKT